MSSPEVSLPSARCWVVSITALHTSLCCRTVEQLDHKKKKVCRGQCITAVPCRPSRSLIGWLCTQRSARKAQTTCWCNLALPWKYIWQLWRLWTSTGPRRNLALFGSECNYVKEHESTKRGELQAKWTQKGLKWWKELRSIRTAEKGITFVLEILISCCQSAAEAQQPACSSVA